LWIFVCLLASITATALCLAGSATYTYDALGRLTVTTYANGTSVTYTLDAAGNRKNVSTSGVSDTTPPTVPGTPTFSSITATTAQATWTAAADNVAVTGYDYSLNSGSTWTSLGNVLTVNLTGLTGTTAYTFKVRARDAAGNTGPSASGSFTTKDGTPPSAPGAITMSNILASTATASWGAATDNVGVVGYDYRVSTGGVTGSWVSLGNVLTVNLSALTRLTTYTFDVRARDAAGNTSTTLATTNFTTLSSNDITPPSAPGALSFSAITVSSATASWGAATDNVGVVGYEYRIYVSTASPPGTYTVVSGGASGLSVGVTGLAAAITYRVDVRAFDAAGNRGAVSTGTFTTPDNIPPSAPGTPSISSVTGTTATASWSAATDNVAVTGYEYQVYPTASGPPGSWTAAGNVTSIGLSGLTQTTAYTFTVRAFDAAGNRGTATSAAFNTADITAPSAPGTPSFSAITASTATASWGAATDNVGVVGYEYRIYVSTASPPASFTAVAGGASGLSVGVTGLAVATTYRVDVRAFDAAGNRGAVSTGTFATIDNVPPSAPGAPSFSSITYSGATASWGAATDNVAVSYYQYRVYQVGTAAPGWTNASGQSASLSGLVGGISYTVDVRAVDTSGNAGNPSTATLAVANPITNNSSTEFDGVGGYWTVIGSFGLGSNGVISGSCSEDCTVSGTGSAYWLLSGGVASNYQAMATNGCGSAIQGTFGTWIPATQAQYSLYLNDPSAQGLSLICSVTISVRAAATGAVLGSSSYSFNVWTGP
jgi:YD repeat-containing protein